MERMSSPSPDPTALQATLVDFALAELLIWLSLNCGCSGDETGLKAFAGALGAHQTGRMRRLFFERELPDLDLQVMADPAEQQVLVLPMGPPEAPLELEQVARALERVGLIERVAAERERWQRLEALVAIPWRTQVTA
jgi:hypothetical protein